MIKRKLIFLLFFLSSLWLQAQNTYIKTSDEDLYRTALDLLDKEKYGAARETFQQYIDRGHNDLRSIDARYYVAYSALNLFNEDAENLFINFIEEYPFHSKASLAYYDLATFYYNNKKYDKAINYFEQSDDAKLSAEQKTEKYFKLGYSYFNQKDFEKAEPLFNKVKSQTNKYTYAASYYAGYLELKNGKYQDALADLKKAEENDAYKSIVPAMIANVYYWQGDYDQLISYSEKTLASTQNIQGKDDIFLMMADAYFYKKNYKKAAENFQKLVTENKSKVTPEIQYRYAYSLYKNREIDAAITQFKGLAGTADSMQQAAAYYLGHAYLKSGNKSFALTSFDIAAKTSFNKEIQEQALFNYGKINFELKRYQDAILSFKNFSKAFPATEYKNEVQELLTESFLRTNNYTEAIAYIESLKSKTQRINKAYQRVTFYNAVQLFNNEQFQTAIEYFDKSLDNPFDKDLYLSALFWKAEANSALKNYREAIVLYNQVLQKTDNSSPYNLKSRYGLGNAYYNTKQYEDALVQYRKYVDGTKDAKNKENRDDALLRLADLYFQDNRYNEAVNYYTSAINAGVKDLDHAYYFKGSVLGFQEKVADAVASLDMVINNYPKSVYYDDAIYQKAQIYFRSGNLEKALSGFTKIINELPNSSYQAEARLRRADVYSNLNKNEEAIADYTTILKDYSSSPYTEDAFRGLESSYTKTGQTEELQAWIDQMDKIKPGSESVVNSKFNSGLNLYFSQKYPQAINAFKSFITSYPENTKVTEAKFYLGDSYYKSGDTASAIEYFNEVIEKRDASFSLNAVKRMAEIEAAKGNYKESENLWKIIIANARNKKEQTNAMMGLMQLYYAAKSYDSCIVYGKQIKVMGNASLDAESKATLYTGKSYYALKDYQNAIDYLVSTANLAKDKNAAEAQYLIAAIQYDQKKYRQSLATLDQFVATYSEYRDWVARAYLLMADNLIALNEPLHAKTTLISIIENAEEKEVIDAAKSKLAEIERKEKSNNE